MSWMVLNGWAQPKESLLAHFPQAQVEDYTAYPDLHRWLAALHAKQAHVDVVVGWSLGGHLAAEALRQKVLHAKALILISAPLQFVRSGAVEAAMPMPTWQQFKQNYREDALRTAKRFSALMAMGDSRAEEIHARMPRAEAMANREVFEHWLHFLETASHAENDLSGLPPTLLIHGQKDAIVPYAQTQLWQEKLPKMQLFTLPEAGHAPHWHNESAVLEAVQEFLRSHAHA